MTYKAKLKPCPCGKTPERLHLVDAGQGGKWAYACGSCCGEWNIEFRTNYFKLDTAEARGLAIAEWNAALRKN